MRIRKYCTHCKDFKVFDNDICETCINGFVFTDIYEIPNDILLKQQSRFLKQRSNKIRSEFGTYNMFFGGFNFLSSNIPSKNPKNEILEGDAGVLYIEKEMDNEKYKEYFEIKEELDLYKDIKRNDKCLCGSNKKYKKCHFEFHDKLKNR